MMKRIHGCVGIGLCFLLAGAGGCKEERVEQLEERAEEGEGVTQVESVKENPERYMGQTIKIAANIEEVYGPRVVRVDGISTVWGDDVLVVLPADAPAMAAGTTVSIEGTVRPMVVAEIEREYDFDLENEVEVEFQGKPILVASTVEAVTKPEE